MNCENCGAPMTLENTLYHPVTNELVMGQYAPTCSCKAIEVQESESPQNSYDQEFPF